MHIAPADRLLTEDPKCFNCRHWSNFAGASGAWGECIEPTSKIVVDEPTVMHVHKPRYVPDLHCCSKWDGINVL
jgi:hypothetical protein